jgi:hypothetical protein
MKQGSTDDPFAEDPVDGLEPSEEAESGDERASSEERASAGEPGPANETADPAPERSGSTAGPPTGSVTDTQTATDAASTASDRSGTAESSRSDGQQRQSLPYIHARDGVKDERTQRPVFLRDHVESGIDGLVAEVEAEVGEDVYKTDVTEAAMAVALENPELVLAKLESWGYGWS